MNMTGTAVPGQVTIVRRTLPNGLIVSVSTDHSLPLVAVNLSYRVGSVDEVDGIRGFAHLFEHLMFQGSQDVAASEHSRVLSPLGTEPNASTRFELTNYFETVSTDALELTLWFEANRMGGMLAALDQWVLDRERDVVKNERLQNMDSPPFGTAHEQLFAVLFPVGHPYHHLPMGLMADLDAAGLDTVRDFFVRHYGPDNCALTLVGDIEADEAISLVEKYFGSIPTRQTATPRVGTTLAKLDGEIKVMSAVPGPMPAVFMGYRGPATRTADLDALTVACYLLGQGETSRLSRRLVREQQSALMVECQVNDLRTECSVIQIDVILNGSRSAEQAIAQVDDQITTLAKKGPSPDELARARTAVQCQVWGQASSMSGLAELIGEAALFAPDADPLRDPVERMAAVTAADIQRVVEEWMAPDNRAVVVYEAGAFDTDEMFDDEEQAR